MLADCIARPLSIAVLAWCGVCIATGARADVVRLQQLEQLALHNRKLLDEYRARTREAKATMAAADADRRPTLLVRADGELAPGGELVRITDAQGDEYLVRGSRTLGQSDAFKPQPGYGLRLGLEQTLVDFGRTSAKLRAARALRDAGRSGESAAREALVADVRDAYLAWATQSGLDALAVQAREQATARRERVEALIAQGARAPSELTVARSDEMLARIEARRARERRDAAARGLAYVVGLEALPSDGTPDPALLEGELSVQASGGAELLALQRRGAAERASARALERTDTALLKASAEAGIRGQVQELFPVYGLMLSLSVPLSDGGASTAHADEARARASALDAKLAEARAARRNRHRDARARQDEASERIQLAEAFAAVARQRVQEAEARYQEALAPLQEVRDARNAEQRAQTELLLAKAARAQARLDLASWSPVTASQHADVQPMTVE